MAHACGEALQWEQEMLNDWSTWIIEDIEDRCREALGSEQERIECQSTEDMAHSCGEALQWEQEMLNDWSTWIIEDIEDRCGEALGSEQERIECRSTQDMCSRWLQLREAWTKASEKVSECHWWFPSTTQRQVMRNALNNSGDGTLTMVPLYRGLSGTKIALGGQWKSRGQVGQTMDVTGGFIYYWYLLHDSSSSHLVWLRGWRSLCYY